MKGELGELFFVLKVIISLLEIIVKDGNIVFLVCFVIGNFFLLIFWFRVNGVLFS